MGASRVVVVVWLAFSGAAPAQNPPASKPVQPLVVEATFPLTGVSGRVGSIAAHPDGARLYVAGLDRLSITSINIVERRYLGMVSLGQGNAGFAASGLVVSDDGRCLIATFPQGWWSGFVGGSNSPDHPKDKPGLCRVYDAEKFDGRPSNPNPYAIITDKIKLRDADQVQSDPVAKRAWVGYREGLALVDTSKDTPVSTVALDENPGAFRLEGGGKRRVFVNLRKAAVVAVLDGTDGHAIDRWKLLDAKENQLMTLDEEGRRLFVVCAKPPKVLAFDTDTGKLVGWTDCVPNPGDVHFDRERRRVYITGDGAINVLGFERDRFKSLGKVTVAPGARTSAWIPSGGRLGVGVPLKGKDSEVWVYRAQP